LSNICQRDYFPACCSYLVWGGNLIGGSLHDSHGSSRPTVVFLLLLTGLLAVVGLLSTSLLLSAANLLCWAICVAALYVLQQQRAMSIERRQPGLLVALNCQSALNIDPRSASKIDPLRYRLVPVVHRGTRAPRSAR
jgi:hypothetical protein